MTTLQLRISDEIAREAEAAGLLSDEVIEGMLREALRRQRVDELFAAADRMAALNEPPLTEKELEAEISAARASRRAIDADSR